jgi:hypothetical protein
MDIDDIFKYIGYVVVGFFVFYLAVKSIGFQYKFVEGFVKKKPAENNSPAENKNPEETPTD